MSKKLMFVFEKCNIVFMRTVVLLKAIETNMRYLLFGVSTFFEIMTNMTDQIVANTSFEKKKKLQPLICTTAISDGLNPCVPHGC